MPHLEHVKDFTPSAVHVGAVVSTPSPQTWPRAGTSSCAVSVSPHAVQCRPSVRPVFSHLAATDGITTVVPSWFVAGITTCSTTHS